MLISDFELANEIISRFVCPYYFDKELTPDEIITVKRKIFQNYQEAITSIGDIRLFIRNDLATTAYSKDYSESPEATSKLFEYLQYLDSIDDEEVFIIFMTQKYSEISKSNFEKHERLFNLYINASNNFRKFLYTDEKEKYVRQFNEARNELDAFTLDYRMGVVLDYYYSELWKLIEAEYVDDEA